MIVLESKLSLNDHLEKKLQVTDLILKGFVVFITEFSQKDDAFVSGKLG